MASMSDIAVHRDGATQILRFNRPGKMNALTGAMYDALCDALEAGEKDTEVSVHVFRGANGVFTSGNDISDFLASSTGDQAVLKSVLRFIRLVPQIQKPMLAGVDGPAVGIGTTLLFHCDLVFATPSARFHTPFLDLGLVPEAASSLLMPQRMGYTRAYEMLVLGKPMDAEAMLRAGLLNAIVPPEELEERVIGAATSLAKKPPRLWRSRGVCCAVMLKMWHGGSMKRQQSSPANCNQRKLGRPSRLSWKSVRRIFRR